MLLPYVFSFGDDVLRLMLLPHIVMADVIARQYYFILFYIVILLNLISMDVDNNMIVMA